MQTLPDRCVPWYNQIQLTLQHSTQHTEVRLPTQIRVLGQVKYIYLLCDSILSKIRICKMHNCNVHVVRILSCFGGILTNSEQTWFWIKMKKRWFVEHGWQEFHLQRSQLASAALEAMTMATSALRLVGKTLVNKLLITETNKHLKCQRYCGDLCMVSSSFCILSWAPVVTCNREHHH